MAVGDRASRIGKLQAVITDPAVRPRVVWGLGQIGGNAKAPLTDDLIRLVPQMSEQEIDILIEDIIMDDTRLNQTSGHQRVLALLERAPASTSLTLAS